MVAPVVPQETAARAMRTRPVSTVPHYTGRGIRPTLLVVLSALTLLAPPFSADAQAPANVRRIGLLHPSFSPVEIHGTLAWLSELGWVEGKNFTLRSQFAAGRDDRLPELVRSLVAARPDVILTSGVPAVLAAKRATTTIPILMVVEGDPIRSGLVASLARPGGNVTGLTLLVPELSGKRLQLLKEAVPGLRQVAVLWNPSDLSKSEEWEQIGTAGRAIGLQVQPFEVRDREALASAFEAAAKAGAGAVMVVGGALTYAHARVIADLAKKTRLPVMYPSTWFVVPFKHGGLMSYAPREVDITRRMAAYLDKLLKGVPPADLPVEQPAEFELVVDLKAARAIGLRLPRAFLARADKVIE